MTHSPKNGPGLPVEQRNDAGRTDTAPPGIDSAQRKPRGRDLSGPRKAKTSAGGSGELDRGTWTTPQWVADMIGPVDLDPCSNPRAVIQAARSCQIERGEDGLALAPTVPSSARVFINPVYARGAVIRWVRAYAHTRFLFLVRFDTSARWFVELYKLAGLVAIPRGRRVNFDAPPGVKKSTSTFPHALIYRDPADATPEVLRACLAWKPR